jgi:hypothetical protein
VGSPGGPSILPAGHQHAQDDAERGGDDQAPTYLVVLEELLAARHRTEQDANNRVECDHGRLKARLRPMRGLKQDRSARIVIAGHALVQNIRRGHYELAVQAPVIQRVAVVFDELALVS